MNKKAREYFPPKSNSSYIYRSFNNNLFNFKKSVDYFNKDKIQVRFDNGINNMINIYEYTDEGVKLSYQSETKYYRQNLLNEKSNKNDYLIKDPIVKDNIWLLSNGSKRCITNIDVEVKTHFNIFSSAIEIVTTSKNSSEFSVDYYVLGIGLVKSIYYINKMGMFYYELDDIEDNSFYSKPIKIYYPDTALNTIWFSNNILNCNTNEDITLSLSKLLETPPKGLLALIDKNTKINTLYYDYNKNFSHIDFSKNIIDNLSENSTKANLFFHSIYNTLKDYYNCSNVSITINNHPFIEYFNITIPTTNINFIEWRVDDCNYPFTYVVKDNDTLITISKKFDINHIKIAKINNIKNPNNLFKNQVIQLYSNGVYKPKENDSLKNIAKMFNLSIDKLIEINNISDLNTIYPGQKIHLL